MITGLPIPGPRTWTRNPDYC